MSDTVIKIEDVSKQYRLGEVTTGSLTHDINRWWHKARGKSDPYLKIGEVNDRTKKNASDYVWALKGINFEVQKGEVLGIIGRNGAGKSTLLKILSRTTTPTTGFLKIRGRLASLLEVGTGFHPELSGRDNIFLNGAILGMQKAEIKKKFDEIVDFSGVEKYIDTPVKRYSSGMYVRLAFAVAAHLESEILIVDEVLAVGDAEFQKKCLGKMGEISAGEGRTILFVSHNIQAVSAICQRGLILQNGTLHMDSDIKTSINEYFNLAKELKLNDPSTLKNRLTRSSGLVQFKEVSCLKQGIINKIWAFDYDDEIEIRVVCMVNEVVDGLTFYLAIKDVLFDTIITNFQHIITTQTLGKLDVINFSIRIPPRSIRSGQYNLYFAIGDKNAKIWHDIIDGNVNLPALIVMPTSEEEYENFGYVSIPYSVSN